VPAEPEFDVNLQEQGEIPNLKKFIAGSFIANIQADGYKIAGPEIVAYLIF
jgi:hypothetical protein